MKGRKKLLKAILCLLVVAPVTFGTAASGSTLNVPDDYPTIQKAIDVAADGDEVLVADGTYKGSGNVGLVIEQKKITIRSQNGPNSCTIDCEGMGRAVTFTGAETEGAVLSGFTIRGGKLVDMRGGLYGGGILCQNGAKPTIENCIITGNAANVKVVNPVNGTVTEIGFGGGIACYNSSPILNKCHIEGNSAGSGGGGLSCIGSSPTITSCTITKNNGGNLGGGVYVVSQSSPSISSCMVTGNSATLYGAGLYCSGTSSLSITNCTVADNTTPSVDENTAGGGLYLNSGSQATIINSILWNNSASQGSEIGLQNQCILKVSYSDIEGGKSSVAVDTQLTHTLSASSLDWSDDSNNIDLDPKFVDVDEGEEDYHLAPGSPCVNAAAQEDVVGFKLSESDFEGDPRVLDSAPDMGGDESQPTMMEYEVPISVMPGSRNKRINIGSWGFLPVVVFSTPEFDATSIDPATVEFAGAEPLHWVRTHVNRDRRADMLFFFRIRQLKFDSAENGTQAPATNKVTLTGNSSENGRIIGTDTVTVINPKNKKHWWQWPNLKQTSGKQAHSNSK